MGSIIIIYWQSMIWVIQAVVGKGVTTGPLTTHNLDFVDTTPAPTPVPSPKPPSHSTSYPPPPHFLVLAMVDDMQCF